MEQCKRVWRNCYKKALEKITTLHNDYNFDVIGIQEVEDKDLVSTICKNTGLQGWYRGATWNSKMKVYSGCAIIWNTNTLGTMSTGKTINLASPDPTNDCNECDARTCCIVTTTKGVNLIVAHFPWLNSYDDVDKIARIIEAHISSDGSIIILADTNDENTLISSTRPLKIKNKNLSHGLTEDEAKQKLNSCCWHKPGHTYENFAGTGDYILSETVKDIKIPFVHPSNDKNEKELYSDHMPVMAYVELTNLAVTPITSTSHIPSAVSNSSKKSRVTNFFNTIIPNMLKSKKKQKSIKYGINAYGSTV